MRKNWLAAARAHGFRAKPLVPDAAFQGTNEPYPGTGVDPPNPAKVGTTRSRTRCPVLRFGVLP